MDYKKLCEEMFLPPGFDSPPSLALRGKCACSPVADFACCRVLTAADPDYVRLPVIVVVSRKRQRIT
jgi:hypothetical protein